MNIDEYAYHELYSFLSPFHDMLGGHMRPHGMHFLARLLVVMVCVSFVAGGWTWKVNSQWARYVKKADN